MAISANNFIYRSEITKIRSLQFLVIFAIGFLLSFLGVFFILLLPLIFLLSPIVWAYLGGWVPKYLIKIGRGPLGKVFSLLPFVQFEGTWLLEITSEKRTLNDWGQLRAFLKRYFSSYAILNIIIVIFFSNVELFEFVDLSNYDVQTNLPWFIVLVNIMGLIFVIISIIEDTEIKILQTEKNNNDVNQLIDLSYAFKSLLTISIGFTVFNLLINSIDRDTTLFEIATQEVITGALYGVGLPFFMSFMYYQSKFHRSNVNNLRMYLLDQREQYDLRIGRVKIDEILCNYCDTINRYPDVFCTQCGHDISTLYSPVIDQPVLIGTIVYEDISSEITDEEEQEIMSFRERLWTTRTKIYFGLSLLFPIVYYGGFILLLVILFGE